MAAAGVDRGAALASADGFLVQWPHSRGSRAGLFAPDNRDVLAGYYVGWVRSTVATVGTFSHGAGAGVICTLPLAKAYGADPLATELTHRLIQIIGASDFAPTKKFE